MTDYDVKLARFAEVLQSERRTAISDAYPWVDVNGPAYLVTVKHGRKFDRVDLGDSGKYMVERETGAIFGIKSYGVVHRGYRYGTLNTVDEWDWGGYAAERRTT